MSDHEDEGASQLVPIKKPDSKTQVALWIEVGLMALTIAQAFAEGNPWTLMIGLGLALKAWRLKREESND
jgi:hypothetical protein